MARVREVGMPRAVVITKLDHARADYDGVLAQAQDAFGDKVVPLYLPEREGEQVVGLVGLLDQMVYDHYSTGAPLDAACATPTTERPTAEPDGRGDLIEGVIEESEDESLMDRYLGGEEIDRRPARRRPGAGGRSRRRSSRSSPSARSPGSAARSCSTSSRAVSPRRRSTPSPRSSPPPARQSTRSPATRPAPLVAEVVKTTTRPLRRPDQPRPGLLGHHPTRCDRARLRSLPAFFGESRGHDDHDEDERIGALSSPFGHEPAHR